MGDKTILIVDDREMNIKLLKGMLISEKYHLFGAASGDEALKMVASVSPDLILLDIMMPGIDGYEVCRRLKQDENTRTIPIVMVTSLGKYEHLTRAMEAGADDFLKKPVDRTELLIRVKSLLRIKSYHDDLAVSYREITEQNKKLRALEKAKSGLTHMIIHDLNNPLTAIAGNLEMLLLKKHAVTAAGARKLENCLLFCTEMKDLIQGLLYVGKMEEGKLTLKKEPTDIAAVIRKLLEMFKTKTEQKRICVASPAGGALPRVLLDRDIVKRVVANLLDNAIRHTPPGGHVGVGVDYLPGAERLRVSVSDNGNGLSPEHHDTVFDSFKQVEVKNGSFDTGLSGLGLSFCKLAVEAHSGRIWVESDGPGRGCAFRFELPV